MIKDYFKMAVSSILHRRLRSWLTMLGIFIGIAAVVALISLGQGLQGAINDQFAKMGKDKVIIVPGGSALGGATSVRLTQRDFNTISRVAGVKDVVGFYYTSGRVDYKRDNAYVILMSYPTRQEEGKQLADEVFSYDAIEGRKLQSGDVYKVVLGYDYTHDKGVFPRRVSLYDTITVNNQSFEVVGFYEKIGSSDDQNVYIPQDTYEKVLNVSLKTDDKEIIAKTEPGVDPAAVAENIKKDLRKERGVKAGNEDFTVQTAQQLLDSFSSILLIVQVVIVGIAAISLVIGGIGIMNTMYTAVVERTQEIGIMKAIGAKNSDVLIIFLIESGMLGLIGGAIGVAVGLGVAKLVEVIGGFALGTPYLKAWWSWGLILGALAFSFLTGAASGVAPAWQASKQKPVDALRYE
jgi:putative ABC transport system permease protein